MEQSALDTAVKRLALALDGLDAAVDRRLATDRDIKSLAEQVQTLSIDRSKLAAALDNETARARKWKAVNLGVAERLDRAIGTIQAVLNGNAT